MKPAKENEYFIKLNKMCSELISFSKKMTKNILLNLELNQSSCNRYEMT